MAETNAAEALRSATNEVLLRTYASLTHILHDHHADPEFRDQRDQVEAEILRRMTTTTAVS